MSNIARIMQQAAAGAAGEALAIEDVFSTYLFTGTGTTATALVTGIDLAGEGGAIFSKRRSSAHDWGVVDTERGVERHIETNNTGAEQLTSGQGVISFNNNGHTILRNTSVADPMNGFAGTDTYVHWTFRKAPRFFDVVTWTGNGSSQQIAHNLGVEPGCIIVKCTSSAYNWVVYHRGVSAFAYNVRLRLNTTDAAVSSPFPWNGTAPTDTHFSVGNWGETNFSGETYVAYLFAHDPLGPSGDGSDGLIACGSYTGNGSTNGPEINLGWEPQWVLLKNASSAENWILVDNMRGIGASGPTVDDDYDLNPNLTNSESPNNIMSLTATGFKITSSAGRYNQSGNTLIYIAIRRGPMRAPTSGTEVFDLKSRLGTNSTSTIALSIPNVDLFFSKPRDFVNFNNLWDRMRGYDRRLATNDTGAEFSTGNPTGNIFDIQYGLRVFADSAENYNATTNDPYIQYFLRRAPGFFDVVAYTGDGATTQDIAHNLGVAPEFIFLKSRNLSGVQWPSWHSGTPNHSRYLNSTLGGFQTAGGLPSYVGQAVSNTTFRVSSDGSVTQSNGSGSTYIAYLFATLPGVSKVGSYTGNGSNQTINCGFTGGARFVLIKRTDSTGDWYVWDTARGIVAGNDPHLSLNTTAAEVTTNDSIDPDSSGFIANQLAATNINVSSASYIYLAIA